MPNQVVLAGGGGMARRRSKARQLEMSLPVRSWGGARKGAGRPRVLPGPSRVAHRARPPLSSHHPVHVTLRLEAGLPSVRRKELFRVLRRAVRGSAGRFGFRVVHYSVQSNHMHLVVEAKGREALSQGMKGLKVRMARGLNGALSRRGKVFSDRYHAHVLKTPREVRNASASFAVRPLVSGKWISMKLPTLGVTFRPSASISRVSHASHLSLCSMAFAICASSWIAATASCAGSDLRQNLMTSEKKEEFLSLLEQVIRGPVMTA